MHAKANSGPGVFRHDQIPHDFWDDTKFFDEDATDDEDWQDAESDDDAAYRPRRWFPSVCSRRSPRLPPVWEETRRWDEHLRRGQVGSERPCWDDESCCDISTRVTADLDKLHAKGEFEKRSPSWVNGWRQRGFVLQDQKLLYYPPDCWDKPLGVLDFQLVRFELHWFRTQSDVEEAKEFRQCCDECEAPLPAHWLMFVLRPIAYQDKVFCFRGPKYKLEMLIEQLSMLVSSTMPLPSPLECSVVSVHNFWRYPFIREAEFLSRADSGDLVLFRGSDRAARLQRAATGADYDHVGLLLRVVSGQVILLEATGTAGVSMIPWRFFGEKKWYGFYRRIAYRKVTFARTEPQMLRLKEYVKSILGNPYGLSIQKLFLDRSFSSEFDEHGLSGDGDNGESSDQGQRTFFCSELTAACLKRCGVLKGARASSTYWPGSFSQGCTEQLELQEHASIGEEQLIVPG